MRLLLINYEFPPIGGGAATATHAIGRALAQMGHGVSVLTSGIASLSSESFEDGMQVTRLPTGRTRVDMGRFREMFAFILKSRRSAAALHRTHPFDASIAFFTIPSGPASLGLFRSDRVPYLVSLRGGDVPGLVPSHRALHLLTRPWRRQILRSATAIIANSEGLAVTSRSADPFPIRVVPNGVDLSAYVLKPVSKFRTKSEATFRLLYVGRIHPDKNLGAVIKQLRDLAPERRSRLELWVAGDGAQRPELVALADRLNLTAHIRWMGWQSKERLPSIYQDGDALVNPSFYEGMPNVVLEAMASGLPVIASDVPGNRSVVIPGETGLLFRLDQPEMLGNAIDRLMDDPDWAAKLGAAGRKRAEFGYSWTATVQSYLELLSRPPSTCSVQ
jgi:glycosyltransferase involved in cell wall biosynthesis